jgi:hypothetical protein|tara:strand:- start:234 stop:506 length:273 start_codon:yes stop_codon:yes gene_type:complete
LEPLGFISKVAIEGIASWYVFMCWVDAWRFSFEYMEPKWNVIRPLLSSTSDFVNDATLWGDIPTMYAEFSILLEQGIEAMKIRFPFITGA